jgi:hypothetical protein
MQLMEHRLELVGTDTSRFDELDVARHVSRLGGSMFGRTAHFPDRRSLVAAWDELCDRFGAGYFSVPKQATT